MTLAQVETININSKENFAATAAPADATITTSACQQQQAWLWSKGRQGQKGKESLYLHYPWKSAGPDFIEVPGVAPSAPFPGEGPFRKNSRASHQWDEPDSHEILHF